jgi:hypothetical protein
LAAISGLESRLYVVVTGGRRKAAAGITNRSDWSVCSSALMVLVELHSGEITPILDHHTPVDWLPTDFSPNLTFKSASIQGDQGLLTTEREVILWVCCTIR